MERNTWEHTTCELKNDLPPMPSIHPTACLDAHAELADDVEVGAYCVIGRDVRLGEGCRLIAHVHIAGVTTVGPRTVIYPFASLGTPPQSVRYRGGPTRLVIGADCQIREGVTMSTGTEDGGGVTEVGERGFFMANSHVGHDCRVGRDVILANGAVLGGHCEIGDFVFMGSLRHTSSPGSEPPLWWRGSRGCARTSFLLAMRSDHLPI